MRRAICLLQKSVGWLCRCRGVGLKMQGGMHRLGIPLIFLCASMGHNGHMPSVFWACYARTDNAAW